MVSPIKVGITGGIGAGKSIICRIFASLGVPVYPADERARQITNTDPDIRAYLLEKYGPGIFQDGQLDRKSLAQKVFGNEKELQELNARIHPRVGEDYQRWLQEHDKYTYTLKEAALIFEAGTHKSLDRIIVVSAAKEDRIQRVLERDHHRTREQVESIMERQWSQEEKEKRADWVIDNSMCSQVLSKVLEIDSQLRQENQGY